MRSVFSFVCQNKDKYQAHHTVFQNQRTDRVCSSGFGGWYPHWQGLEVSRERLKLLLLF